LCCRFEARFEAVLVAPPKARLKAPPKAGFEARTAAAGRDRRDEKREMRDEEYKK
jgi:hypothetical protein